MKKTCQWVGTDALTLVKNPPANRIWHLKLFFYRLKWKVLYRIFDEHYIVHKRLRKHLVRFGIDNSKISVKVNPIWYNQEFKKRDHKGFNVLYYHPLPNNLGGEKYTRWLYGIDLIEKLENFNLVKVDGNQDLSKIYPVIDFYLRPSRHDGAPRMIRECEKNGIPYYYSEDGNPNIEDIKKCLMKWKKRKNHILTN